MAEQHGKALVPQIRFAGFTDPWEQRKLGELTESYSGGTPAAGESEFYGGSIPFIRSAEIASESTELFLTGEGYESSSARMVKPGDVLYALYGATSGEVAVSKQKGAINQAILAILPHDDCDAKYLAAWLRRQKDYIVTTFLQGGQGNLSGVIVKNLEVAIPSLPEQQRIGSCLSLLDSLITLHQRKYDKLCVLKKSMLDKMFPKGGSMYPEIRFAGFTDPWEQRKLGELFEESDERASDREILSVSVANGIYPASESDRETNPGASLANYKIVHFGDVVYNSMRMWQGAVDASRYDGIVSPAYVVTRPTSEVYARFFARLLRQPMLLKQYQQVSQGNSKDTQVLKFDDFASIRISMPVSENEQRQIGAFFDRLDSLITLHQRKYDKLCVLKKSMLDKMFV